MFHLHLELTPDRPSCLRAGPTRRDRYTTIATDSGRRAWAAILADPGATLLCTDFDGVLSPIVADPAEAWAAGAVMDALARLGQLIGHVAVVTGRPAREAVQLGRLAERSGLGAVQVLGIYGLERWDALTDSFSEPDPPAGLAAAATELAAVLAELGLSDIRIEDKRLGLAVHTRELPDPTAALARLQGPLEALAARHGLRAEPGRNVLELRAPGSDKGSAVRNLVAEQNPAVVVFVGDDLGDVAAFNAVRDLRDAGQVEGLLVCSGSDEQDALVRLSDLVVSGPEGVAAFFTRLADGIEETRRSSSTF